MQVQGQREEDGPVDGRLVAGRYRLRGPLGTGGMGTVWRAEDVLLGREVAVKEVTFPHGLSDEDRAVLRERTRREARAAARLDHPSAVTVFDVVEEDGSPFLVMELVDARTLAQVVRGDGPLPPRRAAEVGLAVLGALETAHAQGIVHRDVKPGNVMLRAPERDGGRVVLTDFGIASSPGDVSITSTGLLLGSPSYIAPERARGLPPEPASDLWSLGATLFTAVEGRPPFDGGDPITTVTAVVTGEHAPFVAAGPLAPVLEGLMQREPADRLDADTARRALERVARGLDSGLPGDALPAPSAPATAAGAPPAPPPASADRTAALPLPLPIPEPPAPAPAAPIRPAPDRPAPDRPTARRTPPSGPGRRRGSRALPVALVLLLVLAVGGLGYLLSTPGGPLGSGGTAQGGTAGGGDRDAGDEPDDDEQALDDGDVDVPDDWSTYADPAGWSISHPASFAVGQRGELRQLRDDRSRRTLRIGVEPVAGSPLTALQNRSPAFAGQLRDYRELRLEEREFRGAEAADLEFTFFDQTSLRVLNRRVHVDDRAYTLYWQVNAADYDDSLEEFERLAASFSPGG